MLIGTPAREAQQPGEISHEPDPHRKDLPGIAGKGRHIGEQAAIAEERAIGRSPMLGFTLGQRRRQ